MTENALSNIKKIIMQGTEYKDDFKESTKDYFLNEYDFISSVRKYIMQLCEFMIQKKEELSVEQQNLILRILAEVHDSSLDSIVNLLKKEFLPYAEAEDNNKKTIIDTADYDLIEGEILSE